MNRTPHRRWRPPRCCCPPAAPWPSAPTARSCPAALKRLLAGTPLPTPPHLNPADLLVLHLSEQRPVVVERHDSGGPDLD